MSKFENAYKTIGEVVKIIGLKSKKGDSSPTHTIRYWEKEFPQIKPRKIQGRRYYSKNDVELIKFIKSLIKDQKMSISGVKNILKNNTKKLDDNIANSLKNNYMLDNLRIKSKNLLNTIKKIKTHGKKNPS